MLSGATARYTCKLGLLLKKVFYHFAYNQTKFGVTN